MNDNTASKTKILAEKIVYKAKYFRIIQRKIERNGLIFTKDFIVRNPSVLILPITDNGEIYLESQYRDSFGKALLEVVAGNMEENGNPLETAKRELFEETGLTATHWNQIAKWELSVNMNSPIYVFVASGLSVGKPQHDEDEIIDIIKMPYEDAVKKALTGELTASGHVAAILLYDTIRKA